MCLLWEDVQCQWGVTVKIKERIASEASTSWRHTCALILFLILAVGGWNRDISGTVATSLAWGVIFLRVCDEWLDSKRNILSESRIKLCLSCCQLSCGVSYMGMPFTAGDSLFRCQSLDEMPSWIWRNVEHFPVDFIPCKNLSQFVAFIAI